MNTHNFNKHELTRKIESLFSTAKIGDTITYELLKKALPELFQKPNFSSKLSTIAYKYMPRDYNMAFTCIKGIGYIRLDDSQTVSTFSKKMADKTKTAINSIKLPIKTVERSKLSDSEKTMLDQLPTISLSLYNAIKPIQDYIKISQHHHKIIYIKDVS